MFCILKLILQRGRKTFRLNADKKDQVGASGLFQLDSEWICLTMFKFEQQLINQ